MFQGFHHVAIICSDYPVSKHFYTDILGCKVLAEHYREERDSYKLDLQLPDGSQIELFSFPKPPARPTRPEAQGLRHLAFKVDDVDQTVNYLVAKGVMVEHRNVVNLIGYQSHYFGVNEEDNFLLFSNTSFKNSS